MSENCGRDSESSIEIKRIRRKESRKEYNIQNADVRKIQILVDLYMRKRRIVDKKEG